MEEIDTGKELLRANLAELNRKLKDPIKPRTPGGVVEGHFTLSEYLRDTKALFEAAQTLNRLKQELE